MKTRRPGSAASRSVRSVVALVALFAVVASLGPLWRASRTDPATTLRAR